jgi:hypothetical protein
MIHQQLIELCEHSIVSFAKWKNRDTPEAQQQLAICWGLLKAGCHIQLTDQDDHFINIMIAHPSFSSIESGSLDLEWSTFYIPTQSRLNQFSGADWY